MALGLASSGALRWGPRFRRSRAILIPLGLNLAALAFLGAILAAGTEPGGLPARGLSWAWYAGPAWLVGLVMFRFPRAAGLPVVVLAAVGVWQIAEAWKPFTPLGPSTVLPVVQPLSDRELVTAFALRVDVLDLHPLPVPVLVRWRSGDAPPPEWWWTWVQARGWGTSTGAALPSQPLKFGVYRLILGDRAPSWRLEKPEGTPPP